MKEYISSDRPCKILKAKNFLRFFLIFILVLAAFGSLVLVKYLSWVIVILGLYCVIIVPFIKFPRLELYEDHFKLVKLINEIISKLGK